MCASPLAGSKEDLMFHDRGNQPEETSDSPNAGVGQLDGGMNNTNRLYTLTANNGNGSATLIARIFATGSNPPPKNARGQNFGAHAEHYYFYARIPGDARSIAITAEDDQDSPPTGAYIYCWSEGAPFDQAAPANDSSTFVCNAGSGSFALQWTVAWNGTTWSGTIGWYNTTGGKLFQGAAKNVNSTARNHTQPDPSISLRCGRTF
jgi:hypothetical protein